MNDFPLVSVLIVHYNRPDVLEKVFFSIKNNLSYPNLEFVLSDDFSRPEVIEQIKKIPFDKFVLAHKNEGMGANTNKGIKACRGEYILQLQDDHILKEGFSDSIQKGLQILQADSTVGFIRFLLSKSFRSTIPKSTGKIEYLAVPKEMWKNRERGFFQYSDWPHLKPAAIHTSLGLYLESKPIIYTENEFNVRFLRTKGLFVAYIPGYENIFNTYETESNRNVEIEKRKRRTVKNLLKNYLRQRLPILKLVRFYYWLLKYDYKKRRL